MAFPHRKRLPYNRPSHSSEITTELTPFMVYV